MIRIGLVGLGKIANDQHIPSLLANPDFEIIASASHHGTSPRGNTYPTIEAMLAAEPQLDAVSLCQPPQARFPAALAAIEAGKHVMLEKPPGATVSEVEILAARARSKGVTLFATWHSRHAAAVGSARAWLSDKRIARVAINWKEDVRRWHPGQAWIWEPGGLGVFDPGINALSIATHILPPFFLTGGTLSFPANRAAPIAADLAFATAEGAPVTAAFDWRQTGPQTWEILVETDGGTLRLIDGGARLELDGTPQPLGEEGEYPSLYRHFAALVQGGRSDVDLAPLAHVADAFLRARSARVEAFDD